MSDSIGTIFVTGIVGTLFFLGLLIWLILRTTSKPSQEKGSKTDKSTFYMPDLDSLTDTAGTEEIKEPDDNQISSEAILESFATSLPSNIEKPAATKTAENPTQSNLITVKLITGHIVTGKELITILRDSRDEHLIVQINNTAYRTLVDSPDVKKEFLKIMKELSVVVTKPDENPPSDEEKEISIPKAVKTKTPPPVADDGTMPGDLPSYALDDNVVPTGSGRYKVESVPEFNLAKAIEEYLQHKLKYTSEYANHVLHIHPAQGGGVRIQVDDKYYGAVGDIEDETIRKFFMETIQEWHDRQ